MNVYVLNLTRAKFNIDEVLEWCKNQFEDVALVHMPTNAELHRVAYDNKVTGIFVFYFREEKDYLMFTLRWR